MRILGIMILMTAFSFTASAQTVKKERMESRGDQIQRKGSTPARGNGLKGKKSPEYDSRQGGNRKKKK